jgi:cytochrome P450
MVSPQLMFGQTTRLSKKGNIANLLSCRAIHMDANRYPNPTKFQPERFLNHSLGAAAYANSSDIAGRDHFAYGNGKRICPGLHLAERSLFNMTARLLQTFDIKPALDATGAEIPVDTHAVTQGLLMAPLPYQARFIIRSDKMKHLLEMERSLVFQE